MMRSIGRKIFAARWRAAVVVVAALALPGGDAQAGTIVSQDAAPWASEIAFLAAPQMSLAEQAVAWEQYQRATIGERSQEPVEPEFANYHPAPEPAGMALLLLGALIAARFSRRRAS